MGDSSGRYWITYNGEVYNYRELREHLRTRGYDHHTQSDTEVLVNLFAEYGPLCACMVRGMFAAAVWDCQEKRLTLLRDGAGKKPLFYWWRSGLFAFASEIKALLAHPAVVGRLRPEKVSEYFTLRYVCAPDTIFDGIQKLPPGCWMTISQKGLSIERFWDLPPIPKPPLCPSREGAIPILREMLNTAVRRRTVADVPVGAFLSGGVDSSALVAVLAKMSSSRLRTYSAGFDEAEVSELGHARKVAEHVGTDHHEIVVRPSDYRVTLEQVIWHRDLPASEPADVPIFLLSRTAARDVKVVLSGEGSDEIFGGYTKYRLEPLSAPLRLLPQRLADAGVRALERIPGPFRQGVRYLEAATVRSPLERAFRWFASMGGDLSAGLVSFQYSAPFEFPRHLSGDVSRLGLGNREIMPYVDLKYWLPDNLLERADRLTMASSLELRAPFMDIELGEFCFSLPPQWHASLWQSKRLLKEVVAPLLPAEIVHRKKVGFATPISRWMRGELRPWLGDILLSGACRERGVFNHSALLKLFEDHAAGRGDYWKALWTCATFELWCRQFLDGKGAAA